MKMTPDRLKTVSQPSPKELKVLFKGLNPRFVLAGMDKEQLLRCQDHLHDVETPLAALIIGSARTNSRLQEFRGPLTHYGVWNFFKTKLENLRGLIGVSPAHHKREATLEDIIQQIVVVRRLVESKFIRIFRFDGKDASILEFYRRRQSVETGALPEYPEALFTSLDNNGFRCENLEDIIESYHIHLGTFYGEEDVIISTFPRVLYPESNDGATFETFIYPEDALNHYKREILQAVLPRLKNRERTEVKSPGYKKPYVNYSLYINADAEHEVHQYLGFNSAVRYIFDFSTSFGTIFGLADTRVIRLSTPTSRVSLTIENLMDLSNSCEALKTHLLSYYLELASAL